MHSMENHIQRAELCKREISKYRPFEGELLDEIQSFYRISTTWASNALEGNTLTIGETKVLLEDGITIGGKPLKDTLEACGTISKNTGAYLWFRSHFATGFQNTCRNE